MLKSKNTVGIEIYHNHIKSIEANQKAATEIAALIETFEFTLNVKETRFR